MITYALSNKAVLRRLLEPGQAFPAQQRALVAVTGTAVILVEDLQLVVGGEAPPPGSIWH